MTDSLQEAKISGLVYTLCLYGKSFARKLTLEKLNATLHTGYKSFKCYICDRAYSQKGNLRSHMITHLKKNIV